MNMLLNLARKITGVSSDREDIERRNLDKMKAVFLAETCLVATLIGLAAWGIMRLIWSVGLIDLAMIIGYAVIFLGFLGGMIYLMRKDLW